MGLRETTQQTPLLVEDEIDLFELWEGLVQERLTILTSFLAVIILAGVYAFSITPVHKASTLLLPPKIDAIVPMNVLAKIVPSATVNTTKSVFKAFQINMKSRQALTQIFNDHNLDVVYEAEIQALTGSERLKAKKKAFDRFVDDFKLISVDGDNAAYGIFAQLSLALDDEQVAQILNEMVLLAEKNTIKQLVQQIQSERLDKVNLLQKQIAIARKFEQTRRLDRIAQLEEAIRITKSLGISKPISSGPTLNINNIQSVANNENVALYLLGSDLLESEKRALEQRKNSDAFIKILRDRQEALQLLTSLKIEYKKFSVVQIDQLAEFADQVKPKKVLVLAVGAVLGLMLGVFIALIRRAIKNRKTQETSLN